MPTVERRRQTALRRLFAMLTAEAQARLRTEEEVAEAEAGSPQPEVRELVAA